MSRITQQFNQIKLEGRKGFVPFITAGDPDLPTTLRLIIEVAPLSTVIELGVPFTDPMADGPVIQRASERALRHRFDLDDILKIVAQARTQTDVPIILFSYFNPLLQFGLERLVEQARNCGIDGMLVTDLVPEEATEFSSLLKSRQLDMIFLVAPTSTDARLQMVAERASGFIYAVSRAGVTGARQQMSEEAEKLVQRVRKVSNLPVAVGFGISKAEHVTDVLRYADAAVVGSAIVNRIEECAAGPDLVSEVGRFVRQLL